MENITLEDILQRHFGLKGTLYLKKPIAEGYVGGKRSVGDYDPPSPEFRYWTKAGFKAYGKLTGMLFDLSKHVSLHISDELGREIAKLVDIFDDYEHGPN